MEDRPAEGTGSMLSRRSFLAAGAVGVGGAFAGCLVRGNASELEGTIRMDGSNTVHPHGALMAYEFQWRNNKVRIPASSSGTGGGFQRFCRSETDIQNASRRITDDEKDHCERNDVDWIELEAMLDGIALITHPENDWCDCLTVEQAREMWRSGSPVRTWSDLDSEWPDRRIRFFGRDSASGTFDSFTERLMGTPGNIRRGYSETGDSNVIVRGVRGNEYATGFLGAGFYEANQDDLNVISIKDPENEDTDGCITPNRETIEGETYTPLTRPMYVYINANELHREELQAFTRFYFEEIDDETHQRTVDRGDADPDERLWWTEWAARQVGFYASPRDDLEKTKQQLNDKIAEVA